MKLFENTPRFLRTGASAICAGVVFCLAASGSSSTAWEMNSYRDFLAGRFSGVSLTREGRLTLAPSLETVFASDQPVVWSVVSAPDGTLYAGTGHRGRLYRIDKDGKSDLVWTADQPEIFALAIDPKGVVYAGTSPDGKVFRIENGRAEEYFAPAAKYIWSLAFGKDGALYAGTGDQGKVFRVTSAGQGVVYYESGQSHVMSLAFDQQNRLLAGTEPNGIIYRISARDKAFVLYDANLPEIRAIVSAPDGNIYAAAMGGALAQHIPGQLPGSPASSGAMTVTTTAATVAVTEEPVQSGPDFKPKTEAAKPVASTPQSTVGGVTAQPMVDFSSAEKSAVYRIAADNTVEQLWGSKEENAYDLLYSSGQIVFSTDQQGRIYRLGPDRRLTLVAQTNEGETIRLMSTAKGLLAATGEMGKVYRLGSQTAPRGSYESPVHDAGTVARWGRLSWRGDALTPQGLLFRVRTGNSARPDRTWSEWSPPLTDPDGSVIPSPNARYVQWKAEFAAGKGIGPALDTVALAYLPQNTAPVLRSITAMAQPASTATPKPVPQAAPGTYSITVTDTGDASTSAGTPTQAVARTSEEQVQVTWQAEDAEADRLTFNLQFRGEEEREWKLLKANILENAYAIDSDALADGKYYFRVVASDSLSNPPSSARESELVSAPTLIDNTPPVLTPAAPKRTGSRLEIEFSAADVASSLRRSEYSVDAGHWVPLEPVDGVVDSPRERFVLRLDNLSSGEHLIVVRAFDAAGNAGLAKVVVR